jgi:FMN reductase
VSAPLVAVTAGESERSRTNALARASLADGDRLITLTELDAGGLLGRRADALLDDAVAASASAARLLLATPIYRATYAGSLKVFLDRFPSDSLARTAVILVATGGSRDHLLALDTGLRAVVASLSGWTVPTTVYGTPEDFDDDRLPLPPLLATLERALRESELLAAALRVA